MIHNFIRHKLSNYIDGTIDNAEKIEVEQHLKTCEKCSTALRELQKTIAEVKQINEVEPPAWMAQKIMARVREEAEQNRSVYEKLVSAFLVKLPVKAVAVVFLAVIAIYMYRDLNPQKFAGEPMGTLAFKKDEVSAEKPKSGLLGPGESPLQSKQVPQSPEYKALDMKPEYEKPAPPALADKMAPAPAPAEQPMLAKKEAAMERRAVAPQAAAPVMAENQAATAGASATAEKKSAATPGMLKSKMAALESPSPVKGVPYFRDYRVTEIYSGKHARVDLSSHPDAKTWRTQLIEGTQKGSNFAGHYTIAIWGCGASCSAFGIIDAISGKVYFPKALSRVSWAGWQGKEYGLKFRLDSNLLIVYGSPNEEDRQGTFYYIWRNNDLELIKYTVVK